MNRIVVKRLVVPLCRNTSSRRFLALPPISSRFSTDSSPHFSHQNEETPTQTEEEVHRHGDQSFREGERGRGVEYEDEQAQVLQAALRHVVRLGWSEAAMIAGAKEVGVSPAIIGSFPRKEATLVEASSIWSNDDLARSIPGSAFPAIAKNAMDLLGLALPPNIPTSFKQRAMLVDEIWHAAGDQASDVDWYLKRTALGGLYSATEIYMLTDKSPGFRDTWSFLNNRVKDAFDLGKTVQEAKYLAEAVGVGIGSSLQGFMKRASRG
ncbi:hypothetical protein IFM89_038914 [Coptis chinensis]|uniref:Ubiquinone biosynthesis protein n=1 Tax=Coptis chinensis TaxID=261450 RepID=A0A835M6B6_9MAGN|nr:hypothetical protein IFM89_038914 [Coptis chinensis]